MFATNFPVDAGSSFSSWTMKDLLKTFHELAKDFSPEDQARLWRETALEVYRMKDII